MKKMLLALLLTLTMILPFAQTAYAEGNDNPASDSSGSSTINGKTYFYDQFDNNAYRTVLRKLQSLCLL